MSFSLDVFLIKIAFIFNKFLSDQGHEKLLIGIKARLPNIPNGD